MLSKNTWVSAIVVNKAGGIIYKSNIIYDKHK